MPYTEIEIETQDGRCPTQVFHPEGDGPSPAVIVYMDGFGVRHFGDRIEAAASYHASLFNLFGYTLQRD